MSENSYESESVDSDECERLLERFSSKGRRIVSSSLLALEIHIFMLLVTYLHTVSEMRSTSDIRN